ncbi:MAG: hypothetical protein ACO1O6_09650 [Bacteroidota bacterium]
MTKNKHQGKFHLLAIFAIPALLVGIFLAQNIWVTITISLLVALAVYLLFFRKKG